VTYPGIPKKRLCLTAKITLAICLMGNAHAVAFAYITQGIKEHPPAYDFIRIPPSDWVYFITVMMLTPFVVVPLALFCILKKWNPVVALFSLIAGLMPTILFRLVRQIIG